MVCHIQALGSKSFWVLRVGGSHWVNPFYGETMVSSIKKSQNFILFYKKQTNKNWSFCPDWKRNLTILNTVAKIYSFLLQTFVEFLSASRVLGTLWTQHQSYRDPIFKKPTGNKRMRHEDKSAYHEMRCHERNYRTSSMVVQLEIITSG